MTNTQDQRAVAKLVMQFRIERASKRMGWVALALMAILMAASVASIFGKKYL